MAYLPIPLTAQTRSASGTSFNRQRFSLESGRDAETGRIALLGLTLFIMRIKLFC